MGRSYSKSPNSSSAHRRVQFANNQQLKIKKARKKSLTQCATKQSEQSIKTSKASLKNPKMHKMIRDLS